MTEFITSGNLIDIYNVIESYAIFEFLSFSENDRNKWNFLSA